MVWAREGGRQGPVVIGCARIDPTGSARGISSEGVSATNVKVGTDVG